MQRPCSYLICSVIDSMQAQVSFRKGWSLKRKRRKHLFQSWVSTLVLQSQIFQMLKRIFFSRIALVTQDIFLKVFENALRICMILQSFIITTYLWFLNKSQKSLFFFFLNATKTWEEKRKNTIMLCPFLLSHRAVSINSLLQDPAGLRDNCTGPENWLNTADSHGSPLVFSKCKGNWCPWEKGPLRAVAYCQQREDEAGRLDHSSHGWMVQARKRHVQGADAGWCQRLGGFRGNPPLFKRSE